MSFSNGIVASPIKQYSANEGLANDGHLVHYAKLAHSGANATSRRQSVRAPSVRTRTPEMLLDAMLRVVTFVVILLPFIRTIACQTVSTSSPP